MTLCQQFAHYALGQRAQSLSDAQRNALRRVLMDWLGCAIAGADAEVVVLLKDSLELEVPAADALVLDSRRLGMRSAAMVNAVAAHALELDDIYKEGLFHPGAPVIAAALAVAESRGASIDELLVAILVGYEISTRIATVINPGHYRFWHTTGTVGCIGAAAAAAMLLKCDEEQFAHALANATTFASGLQQAFRSAAMTKPLHAGHAADTGVWTALAAHRGVTGALDILEGDAGFGAAMGGSPDWRLALADLGQVCNTASITFKRHACCGQTFSAVDAVLKLRPELLDALERIERIDVFTNQQTLAMTANAAPTDPLAARFSMAYVLASALHHGDVGMSAFEPERINDPAVRRLMPRIRMQVDAAIDASFPAKRSARIRIQLSDGRVLEHFQSHRKGDPEDPLSDEELEAKFLASAASNLPRERAVAMLERLHRLEEVACLDVLLEGVRRG